MPRDDDGFGEYFAGTIYGDGSRLSEMFFARMPRGIDGRVTRLRLQAPDGRQEEFVIPEWYYRQIVQSGARPTDETLRAKLLELTGAIAKIKEQPQLFATVLKVDEKRVVLIVSGKRVEVNKPSELVDVAALNPGDTVKVTADTMQIVGRADDASSRSGELVVLKAVLEDGVGEIERGGASRVISIPATTKVGDRVVVDESGSIAIKTFGPPPSDSLFGQSTGVTWDDIGGLEEAKASLRDAIEGPFKNRDAFVRFGKKPTRGILLFGPPGCGKTLLGKAAATALAELHGARAKGGFHYVKGPSLLDRYVGNSESNIRKMFDDARRHHREHGFPAVLFLDEADAILGAAAPSVLGWRRPSSRSSSPRWTASRRPGRSS